MCITMPGYQFGFGQYFITAIESKDQDHQIKEKQDSLSDERTLVFSVLFPVQADSQSHQDTPTLARPTQAGV